MDPYKTHALIYKAYCDKNGIYNDYDIRQFIKPYHSKTLAYLKFKYSIRIYAFYLVFRMPFVVAVAFRY